ncbi:MAG: hypothetical protein WCE68_00030 [Anaerolineales bacterium]
MAEMYLKKRSDDQKEKIMSGIIRTTRECSVSQLHPSLFQAIREFVQTNPVGDLESETRLCCETISEKQNPGKLAAFLDGDHDTIVHLAILLTAEWLIWARNGDQSGTVVAGARLKGIQVKPFVARRTKNMELEVSAYIGDSKEYVRGNLELGYQAAAQKFCEDVCQAVLQLNPPAKRTFPRWMGG